jgi:transcriptional regulator with XRE-family HTH domain
MNGTSLIENRIWKYRNIKGLKQEELAFLIGHETPSQVSRYERGLITPALEQLVKLCHALDIKIESLYPQLIKKWQQEVDKNKEKLKK